MRPARLRPLHTSHHADNRFDTATLALLRKLYRPEQPKVVGQRQVAHAIGHGRSYQLFNAGGSGVKREA